MSQRLCVLVLLSALLCQSVLSAPVRDASTVVTDLRNSLHTLADAIADLGDIILSNDKIQVTKINEDVSNRIAASEEDWDPKYLKRFATFVSKIGPKGPVDIEDHMLIDYEKKLAEEQATSNKQQMTTEDSQEEPWIKKTSVGVLTKGEKTNLIEPVPVLRVGDRPVQRMWYGHPGNGVQQFQRNGLPGNIPQNIPMEMLMGIQKIGNSPNVLPQRSGQLPQMRISQRMNGISEDGSHGRSKYWQPPPVERV